ncbi:MAG: RecX family transcriptional regulator [Phycisphaerales bacterium]|nr:RecX family transcriptional regulator [Phycisphaerales bacterium]
MTYDKARKTAMTMLNRRALSRAMFVERLERRGADADDVQAIADEFQRIGLLDDHAYAHALIRTATLRAPAGPDHLRRLMRRDKVDPDVAEAVIAEVLAERDVQDDATTYAAKRMTTMRTLDPPVARRRLLGQLLRRGFDDETSRRAIDAVLPPEDW